MGARESAPDTAMPPMRLPYRLCRWACQVLFTYLMRGRVFGTRHVPRTGGVLLVSNHQSFLDPPLVTLALPRECHYMARDTLWNHGWLKPVIELLNAFPVKRGSADTRAIKELLRRLRAGAVVTAFPEATRTHDGSIGPMRAGVVLVARKSRVPIVPAVILGAFEAWPRTSKLPGLRPIIVAYGQPIYPHKHPEWDDEQCVQYVRQRIIELQQRFQSHTLLAHTRRS